MPNVIQNVQASNGVTGATSRAAPSLTVGAENFLVVFVTFDSGVSPIISVDDDRNGSYSLIKTVPDNTDNQGCSVFGHANCAGGPTVVTLRTGGVSTAFLSIFVEEISNTSLGQNAGQNQQTPTTNNDATTSGNFAVTNYPALLVAFCMDITAAAAPAAGTGFTSDGSFWLLGGSINAATAEHKRILGTPTSGFFTSGSNVAHTTIAVTFPESPSMGIFEVL